MRIRVVELSTGRVTWYVWSETLERTLSHLPPEQWKVEIVC